MFSMFKIDCLASTSIHSKFLATIATPVFFIVLLQLNAARKKRKIKRSEFILGKNAVVSQCENVASDAVGKCFAAVSIA